MRRGSAYTPPAAVEQVVLAEALGAVLGLPKSAPATVFTAGDLALLRAPARIAVVGSREASTKGLERARRVAAAVVRAGGVVVSGLAKGIDRAAHEAAIAAGGRTIAVIGTPLDQAYPPENAELQAEIYREHLLVSQFPSGEPVSRSNFPRRCRLMALVSHATVIVEATDTSGALAQAEECRRLRRDLFILKPVIEDPRNTWPQSFLDRGARVIERPSDLNARVTRYPSS